METKKNWAHLMQIKINVCFSHWNIYTSATRYTQGNNRKKTMHMRFSLSLSPLANVHFNYCHINQITAEPNEMNIAMTIKLINVSNIRIVELWSGIKTKVTNDTIDKLNTEKKTIEFLWFKTFASYSHISHSHNF